jgi:hypothetical protein
MEKSYQDATYSKLGDLYQYLLAISECLLLDEGSVIIENLGDVTILDASKNILKQYEVKHHISDKMITNKNKDFWKTVYNWCKDFNLIKNCQTLIFYTNSSLSENCKFKNWNGLCKEDKYHILKGIYETDKEKEDNYVNGGEKKKNPVSEEKRKYYDFIFNIDIDNLLLILDKVLIQCDSESIELLFEKAMKSACLRIFSLEQKKLLVDSLFSNVMNIPAVKNKSNWEISFEQICSILQNGNNILKSNIISIRDVCQDINIDKDIRKKLLSKKFITEISRIDYSSEIENAIVNYIKANSNFARYFSIYPALEGEYHTYIKNLSYRIKEIKKENKILLEEKEVIAASKKFYHEGLKVNVHSDFSISSEQIKDGVVHGLVEENIFTWHLGDE